MLQNCPLPAQFCAFDDVSLCLQLEHDLGTVVHDQAGMVLIVSELERACQLMQQSECTLELLCAKREHVPSISHRSHTLLLYVAVTLVLMMSALFVSTKLDAFII